MEVMNDMLLVINEFVSYLVVIYDIYSIKWFKVIDFMY